MFYILSTQYVGPNARNLENDFQRIVYGHFVEISTKPGCTNMSHEERADGWLGTTNDWAEYAHGEFETPEAAQAARAEKFPETFIAENDPRAENDYEGVILERVYVGEGENVWSASDWCWEEAKNDVQAGTTDEELEKLAADYEADAAIEGAILWDDVGELLREIRDEKRAEADEDEAE